MLKVGDKVRWVGGDGYGPDWSFMLGATATIVLVEGRGIDVKWDDHEDNERQGGCQWYVGRWQHENLEPAAPLSPFDQSVRDYVNEELRRC